MHLACMDSCLLAASQSKGYHRIHNKQSWLEGASVSVDKSQLWLKETIKCNNPTMVLKLLSQPTHTTRIKETITNSMHHEVTNRLTTGLHLPCTHHAHRNMFLPVFIAVPCGQSVQNNLHGCFDLSPPWWEHATWFTIGCTPLLMIFWTFTEFTKWRQLEVSWIDQRSYIILCRVCVMLWCVVLAPILYSFVNLPCHKSPVTECSHVHICIYTWRRYVWTSPSFRLLMELWVWAQNEYG